MKIRSKELEYMKDNQDDKISVIIPFFEVEKYIRKCINSVISQTYTNLEIILIDDGSPDVCGKICDEYAKKDSRIKVVHKKNEGLSAARNTGIKIATGKYIAFVDGDDYIHPDMYRLLHLNMVENEADIAICNFLCVDESGNPLTHMNKEMPIKSEVLTGREILETKTGEITWWYWIVAWNRLYKKELFEGIQFPIGKQHEDEFTAHLFWNKCRKVSCIEDALYMYVQRANSIMSKKYSVKRMDAIEACLRRIRFLLDNRYSPECIYRNFISCYRYIGIWGKYADRKEIEIKEKYKALHYEYRKLYIDLMKNNVGIGSKIRYTLYYISPYYYWRFISILAKTKNGIKDTLMKKCFFYMKYFFSYSQKYMLLDTPTHGNLGDHAIAIAEKQVLLKYLHRNNICEMTASDINNREYRLAKMTSKNRILFVHGGGFLGYLWPDEEERFRRILQAFKKQKIIVLPQTVTFDTQSEDGRNYLAQSQKIYSSHPNLTIFVREKKSYDFMKEYFPKEKCFLVPDIVTIMQVEMKRQKRSGILFCLRADQEKIIIISDINGLKKWLETKYPDENIDFTDTVLQKEISLTLRKEEVMQKLAQFSKAKLVVTDRLHGMIFAAITNTPCLAMGNINGKVKSVYEWIKNNSYVKYIDSVNDVEKVMEDVDLEKTYTYDNSNVVKNFKPLIKMLEKLVAKEEHINE